MHPVKPVSPLGFQNITVSGGIPTLKDATQTVIKMNRLEERYFRSHGCEVSRNVELRERILYIDGISGR